MKTPEELAEEYADDRCCKWEERERWEDAKTGYLAGYQAAQEHLADADKVMNSPETPDTCDHIVDVSKMVDLELHNEFYNYKHGHSFIAMAYVKHLEEVITSRNSSGTFNNWISVAERLPTSHKAVMWYLKDNLMAIGSFDDNEQGVFVDTYFFKLKEFTHWQPLPEPPKEEG